MKKMARHILDNGSMEEDKGMVFALGPTAKNIQVTGLQIVEMAQEYSNGQEKDYTMEGGKTTSNTAMVTL